MRFRDHPYVAQTGSFILRAPDPDRRGTDLEHPERQRIASPTKAASFRVISFSLMSEGKLLPGAGFDAAAGRRNRLARIAEPAGIEEIPDPPHLAQVLLAE